MENNKVYIFLANGCEEIEALTVVDLLRRAQIPVVMTAIGSDLEVQGSHGINFKAETRLSEADLRDAAMLVIPGGMPGTKVMREDLHVREALQQAKQEGKYLAAICAGPTALGMAGLLVGEKATCYPGCEELLTGAVTTTEEVVVSGQIITSRGLGTAIPFALKLIETLKGEEVSKQIAESVIFRQ